tara:strand:- start:107 stop:721 length:615 start_codon:yes stop_codon:yes gene_type:complete
MAKKLKIDKQDYAREPISKNSPIKLFVGKKVSEELKHNTFVQSELTKYRRIEIGIIGLNEITKQIAIDFKSNGVRVYGYDENVFKAKTWWQSKVPNPMDQNAPPFSLLTDFAPDIEALIDQCTKLRAYPDGSDSRQIAMYIISLPEDEVDSTINTLKSLIFPGDLIFDCNNKKLMIILKQDETKILSPEPVEIPFACFRFLGDI